LPENAIANILTKSGSLLQDSPRDRASVGYLFGLFTRFVVAVSHGTRSRFKAQDLFYIRNWSIWLDIYILLQTVIVVLNGRGAK
jgi:lipopolysaccharide/colanic/teichoic acid biosynthesis glycosyltransferase